MKTPPPDTKERNLGAELFALVELDQGYSFVSDAISGLPDEKVFDIARGALNTRKLQQGRFANG